MVDFSNLLKRGAGTAKRPKALPVGVYDAVIKAYERGESAKKKTPFIRFNLTLLGWPEDIEQELRVDGQGLPIELAKKRAEHVIYLTEDSMFRLDEFLATLGLELDGKTYEQVLPETIGQSVKIELQQVPTQDGQDTVNQFGKCTGVE